MRPLLPAALFLALSAPARAQAPGLYSEDVASFGEVEVRRVRDTREGVVCWVAQSTWGPDVDVAMSCMREKP